MSAAAVEGKVLSAIRTATGGDVDFKSVVKKTYPRSGEIYVATPEHKVLAPIIYAQVVSRAPVCDLCHGVHFILVFDAEGLLRYFEPLHLTKYGNVKWSVRDADYMRRKIVGMDVRYAFDYDPSVDSVTTATMTSVIVFDSVQRLHEVLKEVSEK
jgi:hypothetical protein